MRNDQLFYTDVPLLWAYAPETGPSVLIVEDDPFWQEAIKLELNRTLPGCTVTLATNADDAYDFLKEDGYDLVIADHFLEGSKTGTDLMRFCRSRRIGVPFLLTSGKTASLPIEPGRNVDFIRKPMLPSEMNRKIRDLLDPTTPDGLFLMVVTGLLLIATGMLVWPVLGRGF